MKVKYATRLVLSSKVLYEGVSSVLQSLRDSEVDDAKSKLAALIPAARNERERGSLLAASGILASITKAKDGTLQTWSPERVSRAASSISGSQMSDEFDQGYAETLVSYSKLTPTQA
ncbi:MAG: hypothetical protein HY247_02525 [archaeon]|nr:MAG: hypothetical protein HY247_02525 [archaeon]